MMSELIALLTTAKQAGFDLGSLVSLVVIYFMLKRDLIKVIDKQFDKLIVAINSLEKAHNERLSKIEYHIGIKKGE